MLQLSLQQNLNFTIGFYISCKTTNLKQCGDIFVIITIFFTLIVFNYNWCKNICLHVLGNMRRDIHQWAMNKPHKWTWHHTLTQNLKALTLWIFFSLICYSSFPKLSIVWLQLYTCTPTISLELLVIEIRILQ